MDKDIIKYLQKNKDRYSRQQLTDALRTSGHSEEDIRAAAEVVYNPSRNRTGFWGFKVPKYYVDRKEKILDLVTGFFLFFVWAYVVLAGLLRLLVSYFNDVLLLSIFVGAVFLVGFILGSIFFFIKRRFMFYGMVAGILSFVLFIIIVSNILVYRYSFI